MSQCRTCRKSWPPGTSVCPDDGTPLAGGVRSDPDSGWSEPALALQPSVRANDLHAGTLVGEYRIEGKLGEGGMGSVYAATHPLIGKKAAVKVISHALCTNAAAVERFVQEARAVNQIGHPNIVDVFSFGALIDGRSYFVMEWLQGETLGDRMARGRVPLNEAADILDQISDALEAAHDKQIVHRDLKPANVVLMNIRGNRQLVKLLDFGLAKLAETDDNRLQKTRTGVMMGTPEYVSPEQARGKNVDHRTDIYALGVIAYELLVGRLPFEADNAADIITKHLREAPPPPSEFWPEIPQALEQLILAMLEKDPAKRPTLLAVRQLIADLRAVLGPDSSSLGSLRPRLVTPPAGYVSPPRGTLSPESEGEPAASGALTIMVDPPIVAARRRRNRFILFGAIAGLTAGALIIGGLAATNNDNEPAPVNQAALTPPLAPNEAPLGQAKVVDPPPSPVSDDAGKERAEQATAPPVLPGTVTVTLNVTGDIWVNDRLEAESVKTKSFTLEPGTYSIVAKAAGRKTEEEKIDLTSGGTRDLQMTLSKTTGGGRRGNKKNDKNKKPPEGSGQDRDKLIAPF